MNKRIILAIVAVFIAWNIMDFVIHGLLLGPTYQATEELWRPHEEMKMGLMYVVTLVASIGFVLIYSLIGNKSIATGIKLGIFYGIAAGIGMGFGTYSVTPIPLSLAWSWLIGTIAETIVAGIITAAIVKEPSGA